MKKSLITAIAVLAVLMFLCTGAFAHGNAPGGSGPGGNQPNTQSQGGNQPPNGSQTQGGTQMPGGGQMQNSGDMLSLQIGPGEPMNANTDAIENAISKLTDEETAASLTALLDVYKAAAEGDDMDARQSALQALRDALAEAGVQNVGDSPMNNSYNYGRDYGRFLDSDAVAEAIATVTDADVAATLNTLLSAYEEAVNDKDPRAAQEALDALLTGLSDVQLQVSDYTGLQLFNADRGSYLDTDAVAEAIAALTDADTVSNLTTLLNAYVQAIAGGDAQATQEAFSALMEALAAAGVQG